MHEVGAELVLRDDDVDDAFGILRRPAKQPMQAMMTGGGRQVVRIRGGRMSCATLACAVHIAVVRRSHQGRCCASANALKYDSPGFSATAARFERWESMDGYIYEAKVTGSNGHRERQRALRGRLWFRGQVTEVGG